MKIKKKFIVNFKKISISDKCFQNFTDDLILLYLIEKPSCTKFIASWLASPNHLQKEYIKSLEKTKPNFIVYNSLYFKVDGVPMSERLSDVNKFILKNYEFYENLNSYDILKLRIKSSHFFAYFRFVITAEGKKFSLFNFTKYFLISEGLPIFQGKLNMN